jgi:hypothetical protein
MPIPLNINSAWPLEPLTLDRLPATLVFSNYSALPAVCSGGSLNASSRSGFPQQRRSILESLPGQQPSRLVPLSVKFQRHRTGEALSNTTPPLDTLLYYYTVV